MTSSYKNTIHEDPESNRLYVVDGLRGIAILLVIYQHAFATTFINLLKAKLGIEYAYLVSAGWMGVSFFFVLSGFVLALPYFSHKRNMSTPGEIRRYYLHRARRLLPLFIFMAFVSLAFHIHKGEEKQYRSLYMTLSTASMFSKFHFFSAINPPFWSLIVEIWFSIFLPVILLSIYKFGLKRTTLAIVLVALAIRIGGSYYEFILIVVNPIKDFFIARCDDFIAGIIVCYLYKNGKLPDHPRLCFAIGATLIFIAAIIWDFIWQDKLPRVVGAFTNLFTSVGFCFVLVAALKSKKLLSNILSAWWLRMIGAMCFSIYCWHMLLISQPLLDHPHVMKIWVQFVVCLLVLSAFTYRYIECAQEKSFRKVFMLDTLKRNKLKAPKTDAVNDSLV